MKLLDCLDHAAGLVPKPAGRAEIQMLVDYFTAWNDHDIDAILGLLTEDAAYDGPSAGGDLGGRALRREIDWLWASFPDLWFEIESLDRHDDKSAVAQWIMHGRNTGPIFGLGATGLPIRVAGVDILRFRNGLIAGIRSRFDSVDLVRQLGIDLYLRRG